LHEKGIIHQDIKPDNILIDGAGHCVITDFGLSTFADVQSSLLVSRRNPPGGTPDYTAPEIRLNAGDPSGATEQMFYWDHSADYWSLGATIFHLQTREVCHLFGCGWPSIDCCTGILVDHVLFRRGMEIRFRITYSEAGYDAASHPVSSHHSRRKGECYHKLFLGQRLIFDTVHSL
jgi:serine/threonine protein kinase